ncbi:uncharacterized protein LOC130313979 [Hyla sarda]|uniref:uncharacterized protein LOC130313979 n=1 Tax=Hyla sarda TaxID=327740 RepID=UPI0024C2BB00|nr:uncharacterized protein LOC130313979 [Hyla sarda]
MGIVYILLLIQGITGQIVLHEPQNIVSMDVNGTAVITCVSNENSFGPLFSWYHKKWGSIKDIVRVKSCINDNDTHKYACKHEKNATTLEIYNVQINDSGVYYCRYHNRLKFGNGTCLNVEDVSTSNSSIYIVSHVQPSHPDNSLQMACVVLGAHNAVNLSWNISGTYHKGHTISKEGSDGTWTVLNFISLPKDNWHHGVKGICEAWIKSSPISVHWEISGQGEIHGCVACKCENFRIPVVTAGILLLLILSIHLICTLRLTDNKTPCVMEKNIVIEDEVTYSELNINNLTRFKKHHVL